MKPEPPKTLLPELEALLTKRPPGVLQAVRHVVCAVRPCVRLASKRVGGPIKAGFVDRLWGRSAYEPSLSFTASKFGGTPYAERPSDVEGGRFIGQVNFAEATDSLVRQGFPIPAGMPVRGLLAVDLMPGRISGRPRWYPEPSEAKAVRVTGLDVVAKYEASLGYKGSWSLRGLDWFDGVPEGDDELWNYLNDLEVPGVDEDARNGHKLFGHANEVLNEHYGLEPKAGRSADIREYALVWRIDFDRAAGFSWGTNWLYVVIHRDDLAAGAFEHCVVTGANA